REAPEATIAQTCVGFLFQQLEPIEVLLLDGFLRNRIEEKVGYIVSQRTADEKLHREVIDSLRVSVLVGFLRLYPTLRQDIAHGPSDSFKALSGTSRHQFYDIVEDEMPFIEAVMRSRERNRPAAVLLDELRHFIGSQFRGNWIFLRLRFHRISFSEIH